MIKEVSSDKAPKAIGPYSQSISNGSLMIISGQLPINSETGEFSGENIKSQTRQSLENIKAILAEAGLGMADVMKSTVYLQNMSDFKDMNEVYAEYFNSPFPARAAFEVAKLPLNALVEIEVIANHNS
ncbi:MAG: RidA family protein [Spirochaetales bacterium]|nr:RidA family protein [Spirochaetales bacterium]